MNMWIKIFAIPCQAVRGKDNGKACLKPATLSTLVREVRSFNAAEHQTDLLQHIATSISNPCKCFAKGGL